MIMKNKDSNSHHRKSVIHENGISVKNEHDKINIFEDACEIFLKPWDNIGDQEKEIVITAMSQIEFFRESKPDQYDYNEFILKCCEMMNYEFVPKGTVIFHFGERGEKFYIILKGSVNIYIPRSENEILQEIEQNELKRSQTKKGTCLYTPIATDEGMDPLHFLAKSQFSNTPLRLQIHQTAHMSQIISPRRSILSSVNKHKILIDPVKFDFEEHSDHEEPPEIIKNTTLQNKAIHSNTEEVQKSNHILPSNYYVNDVLKFKCIKTIGPGSYFGEVALTTNKPRLATILAIDDTHLVTLTKKNFKEIFEYQISKMKEKLDFFANVFDGCSMESISKFSYAFDEKHYKFGQHVYLQNDPVMYLYIIKTGEIQLIFEASSTKNNNKIKQIESSLKGLIYDNDVQAKSKLTFKYLVSPNRRTSISRLVNIGSGSFFGEDDIFDMVPHRSTAISMDSSTVLYCLPIEDYHYMALRYPDIIEKIKNKLLIKNSIHNERLLNLANIKEKLRDTSPKNTYIINKFFDNSNNNPPISNEKSLQMHDKTSKRIGSKRVKGSTTKDGLQFGMPVQAIMRTSSVAGMAISPISKNEPSMEELIRNTRDLLITRNSPHKRPSRNKPIFFYDPNETKNKNNSSHNKQTSSKEGYDLPENFIKEKSYIKTHYDQQKYPKIISKRKTGDFSSNNTNQHAKLLSHIIDKKESSAFFRNLISASEKNLGNKNKQDNYALSIQISTPDYTQQYLNNNHNNSQTPDISEIQNFLYRSPKSVDKISDVNNKIHKRDSLALKDIIHPCISPKTFRDSHFQNIEENILPLVPISSENIKSSKAIKKQLAYDNAMSRTFKTQLYPSKLLSMSPTNFYASTHSFSIPNITPNINGTIVDLENTHLNPNNSHIMNLNSVLTDEPTRSTSKPKYKDNQGTDSIIENEDLLVNVHKSLKFEHNIKSREMAPQKLLINKQINNKSKVFISGSYFASPGKLIKNNELSKSKTIKSNAILKIFYRNLAKKS